MRLLFITDYSEQFAYRLMRGIIRYARNNDPWTVSRMPTLFKKEMGLEKTVEWAVKWKADVVIGTFDPDDDVRLFHRHGIVVLAQDYISKFSSIPNITADYELTGAMAAEHLLTKGFQNFGFFGYRGVCWSDSRRDGFIRRVADAGFGDRCFIYDKQSISNLWDYEQEDIVNWLRSLPKPVAIMACDDNQGNFLLEACNSCGIRIPFDVAIVGVDNDEVLCNMTDPSMSSVNIDIEAGGYEAAALAARMVAERTFTGEDIVLRPLTVVSRVSTTVFATKDNEILEALKFIHSNIERKISVTDVLDKVPLSRRLFEIRFKNATGCSVYSYIANLRMDHFADLLLTTNDPISEIAARMDEVDTKSISRRFKEIKGCTPSEFRNRNK